MFFVYQGDGNLIAVLFSGVETHALLRELQYVTPCYATVKVGADERVCGTVSDRGHFKIEGPGWQALAEATK